MTTHSSSDYQGQPTTSDDGSRPSSGVGMTPRPSSGGHLEAPPIQGSKFRGASFNSELSEGSSTRSLVRCDDVMIILVSMVTRV